MNFQLNSILTLISSHFENLLLILLRVIELMVRVIAIKNLKDFCESNSQYKEGLEAWISIVQTCEWEKPQDIVKTFGEKAVDILKKKDNKPATKIPNRVVFDVRGNNIRIIAKYLFHKKLKEQILYKNMQYDIDLFG